MSQHLTDKIIKNSREEINIYLKELMACSVDDFYTIEYKINIHKEAVYIAKEFKDTVENEYSFSEIVKILDGLKGIKGITPLELISNKLNVLKNHIIFLNDVDNNIANIN